MNFKKKCALRFVFSKSSGRRGSTVAIILSITIGLVALIIVSTVMNGLQTRQLDKLRSVESFDLIVENSSLDVLDFSEISQVSSAFEFIETSVIVENKAKGLSQTFRLRAFDYSFLENERLADCLTYNSDQYTFEMGLTLSLGKLSELGLKRGNTVEVTFLRKGKQATVVPYKEEMTVSSSYASNVSDFSSTTVIADLTTIQSILNTKTQIGIYCSCNSFQMKKIILEKDPNAKVTVWQEYNKALYSALLLEKIVMYIFMLLIFIIVCVALKNSTKRLIDAKLYENGILMALGMSKKDIIGIYNFQSFVITSIGLILGMLLGYIVSKNLNTVLQFADFIIYLFSGNRTILTYMAFESYVSYWEIIIFSFVILLLSFVFTNSVAKRAANRQVSEVISDASC